MRTNLQGEHPQLSETRSKARLLDIIRVLALIAVVVGAAGSLRLMLVAGHRNPSRLLIAVFAFWVVSPFIALVWANVVSRRWSVFVRATLYVVMFVITVGSFAVYGTMVSGALVAKTGFVFLVVPAISWVMIAIVIAMAAMIPGGFARRS